MGKGFTVIEFLVVLAIFGILMAILVPSCASSYGDCARLEQEMAIYEACFDDPNCKRSQGSYRSHAVLKAKYDKNNCVEENYR